MSTFLPQNRTSFYTRVVIPKGLRIHFEGRREVWRSLGTKDREEAQYRAIQFEASGRRLFRYLAQQGGRMDTQQVEALVSRWLVDTLEDDEAWRETYGPITDERASAPLFIQGNIDDAKEALASNDFGSVRDEVINLLKSGGLPIPDHTSASWGRFCRRFLRAKVEFSKIQLGRWNGEYHDNHREAQSLSHTLKAERDKPEVASLPFSVVFKKYLLANPRPARTNDPLEAEFMRFIETIGGDRPIASITRADCVAYKESLQVVRKLSLMTCIKHLSNLETLFKWAGNHDHLPEGKLSPARGLAPSKRQAKKQSVQRRPFTTEELLMVLGSKEFLQQRTKAPEQYWIVLLLLFEGCRREEAAQLYLKDLSESDEGIQTIKIRDEEPDQTLKNAISRRTIPLHSGLVKLGFLKYVEAIKKAGHKRLFPQLTRKGKNGYADPAGKWFGRLVTKVGLADPRLVLHSLRRGFITALHSAGVPGNIAQVITGHAEGSVHEQYVHRELISMKTLQEGLERVQYPEVVKRLL